MAETDLETRLTGIVLAQQVLVEALVRHDAIAYHQMRETMAQALATLESAEGVNDAVLAPLRGQLALLDAAHQPVEPGAAPRVRDWRELLAAQLGK